MNCVRADFGGSHHVVLGQEFPAPFPFLRVGCLADIVPLLATPARVTSWQQPYMVGRRGMRAPCLGPVLMCPLAPSRRPSQSRAGTGPETVAQDFTGAGDPVKAPPWCSRVTCDVLQHWYHTLTCDTGSLQSHPQVVRTLVQGGVRQSDRGDHSGDEGCDLRPP